MNVHQLQIKFLVHDSFLLTSMLPAAFFDAFTSTAICSHKLLPWAKSYAARFEREVGREWRYGVYLPGNWHTLSKGNFEDDFPGPIPMVGHVYIYIVTRYYILYLYYLLDTIAVFIYIYIYLCLYNFIQIYKYKWQVYIYIHILFQRQVYLKIYFISSKQGTWWSMHFCDQWCWFFPPIHKPPKKHYHRYYLDQGSSLSKIDCQFHMWWCGGLWLVI